MDTLLIIIVFGLIVVSFIVMGTVIVRQNEAVVVERLGKFQSTLYAGIHIIIPFVDRRAYSHTLKETAIDLYEQQAISKDNVALTIDGVLYFRIVDPKLASYGIDRLHFAITQLAQTTMRAVIGRLELDETFESRDTINASVTTAVDEAAGSWGTKITRYEIRDISPPITIKEEMEKQMGAEREKRAEVLRSEGYKISQINQADGDKRSMILRAEGRAQAVILEANARADSIRALSKSITETGGIEAVSQLLSEQYIDAFKKLAREGTVAIIPNDSSDISSAVVKGFNAFDLTRKSLNNTQKAESEK